MRRASVLFLLCLTSPALGVGGHELPGYEVVVDLSNRAALQRGAKYFVNYCLNCHSLKYSRYSRAGEDIGLDLGMVEDNLIFTDQRSSERMEVAMSSKDAEKWFGAAPPDLSMIARQKGASYIYQYLMTFYVDDSRPWGVNNWRFPNTAMPHVLWQVQGLQRAQWEEVEHEGETVRTITGLTLETPGLKTHDEYRKISADITSFLTYAAEPARLVRERMGLWVSLFLLVLAGLAYFLKREYWKDIH